MSTDATMTPLKKALVAVEKLRARVSQLEEARREPIALVGLGCRFPGGATSPAAYWALLSEGRDAIVETPADRWDADALYDPDARAPGRLYTRHGGFLTEPIDQFDAAAFGVSPREAALLDPQQRLVLEVAWEALEDAGIPIDAIEGSNAGVFIGVMSQDYARLIATPDDLSQVDAYFAPGTCPSFNAGRLTYVLGAHGPSIAVDTACSSSGVAIHLACQSLRAGDCDLALAGGVNLILTPEISAFLCKASVMSRDGHCRTFSADASGIGRGEGCGVVVLERLSRAVDRGDRILALIRGSAVNHDGPSGGLTVPNGPAQQQLIRTALANAGVAADQVDYVEAHGTATNIGDPIEVGAIQAVLGAARSAADPLAIGSVKTNFGHTEAAAAIAGLIKVVLSLRHREIPPHLHLTQLSTHIPWEEFALTVPTRRTPWPERGRRIAGVSSFGLSGVNAHVVVEEGPAQDIATGPVKLPVALPISARSAGALRELAARYVERLKAAADLDEVAAICRSAGVHRAHFEHRLCPVAHSGEELIAALEGWLADPATSQVAHGHDASGEAPRVVFVFPGQGSQWRGMALELMRAEPAFRAAIESCERVFRDRVDWSLLEQLEAPEAPDRIDIIQPMLFAVDVALAHLWMSWGVMPSAVVGHSMGETMASHIAGALSLEDAARVICGRSKLMRRISGKGAMAVVELTIPEAEAAIAGHEHQVSIAVSNGPRNTVLSGDPDALEVILEGLRAREVFCRFVKVDVASHSPQTDPLAPEIRTLCEGLAPRASEIPMVSTVRAAMVDGSELDGGYWVDNLRQTVQFARAVDLLLDEGHTVFVESSPHPILLPPIEGSLRAKGVQGAVIASVRRDEPERPSMVRSAAELYVRGVRIDWGALDPVQRRADLPTYPWQRERHWVERRAGGAVATTGPGLLGAHVALSEPAGAHVWNGTIDPGVLRWLPDHKVRGLVVVPGTAYLELALEAAAAMGLEQPTIREAVFEELLVADSPVEVQVRVEPYAGRYRWWVLSRGEDGWIGHAHGEIHVGHGDVPTFADRAAAQARCGDAVAQRPFFEVLAKRGLQYGPAFQSAVRVWSRAGEALAQLDPPETVRGSKLAFHPALLDGALQISVAATSGGGKGTYLPIGVGGLEIRGDLSDGRWAHFALDGDGSAREVAGDVLVAADDGRVLAVVRSLRLRRVDQEETRTLDEWLFQVGWAPCPPPDAQPLPNGGTWVIFADRTGMADALEAKLAGQRVVRVTQGMTFARQGDHIQLDPAQAAHFPRLLEAAGNAVHAVVFLWSLDAPSTVDAGMPDLIDGQVRGPLAVLHLVQALAKAAFRDAPRLWLVTRGAQHPDGNLHPGAVAQSTLWGLGRTIVHEHPDLRCTRIDLDPAGGDDAGALFAELTASDGDGREDQVAHRGDERLGARLRRWRRTDAMANRPRARAGKRSFRVETLRPGLLGSLTPVHTPRRPPGPGEVEIEVKAAGLNFLDVLKAMGIEPGQQPGGVVLGCECAGVICAVGPGVDKFQIGDPVVACEFGSFTRHLTTLADRVVRKPDNITFEEAASIPINFMTSYYSLVTQGHVGPGETVLVHSAAGGTGLAAVQIARHAGAEVIGTASTEERFTYLKSIGVKHTLDSRSLAFKDDVTRLTDGQGVDIVLNSLTGEAVAAGIECLAPYGRFVEIGKKDIYGDTRVGLLPFRRNLSYHAVDLASMIVQQPARAGRILAEVLDHFASGAYQPVPLKVFPIADIVGAFEYMAHGKRHLGKIVLSLEEAPEVPIAPRPVPAVRPDATYVVTGGLGGVGLVIARWMVDQGARSLVLCGRSAPSGDAIPALEAMRATGARVEAIRADVSDADDVARMFGEIDRDWAPLAGVVHSAGVLADGMLASLDRAAFHKVMAPKVNAAWLLHEATKDRELDHFVLFASASGLLGMPGQGNYAAANAFLDALAHARRAMGLPAMSIDWGSWGEVGLAAAESNRGERLAFRGLAPMTNAGAAEAYGMVVTAPAAQVGIMPFQPRQWREFYLTADESPFLNELTADTGDANAARSEGDLVAALRAAPSEARLGQLTDHLRDQLAKVLRLPAARVEDEAPFTNYGLDSLTALEYRNRLEGSLGLTLPATLVWSHPTVCRLATHLAERLDLTVGDAAPAAPEPESLQVSEAEGEQIVNALEQLAALSAGDLEAALLASLKGE